jgi:hypothetical protein
MELQTEITFEEAIRKIEEQLTDSPQQILDVYGSIPITFLKTFNPSTKWPKKLREIFADIWTGKAGHNVIIKSCRGGGKSQLLGSLGFAFFFFKHRSVIDMAGSLAQAKIVYNYFTGVTYSDPRIIGALPKEPMMERSEGMKKNYFACVAASPKAVRGPHPDILMADEVCETPDELIESALPMVDTSAHPLRVLTSTFHKVFGIFQDVWDRADELGYTRYSWDIFDVAKEFDMAVFDDKQLNREIPDLQKLKELTKGRTGDPDGWIPIENIINAWRSKRSLAWFLTEYMGERPSAEGLVLDPVDVDAAAFEKKAHPEYNYVAGSETAAGLDWGFSSMTAFTVLMQHLDAVKVQVENKNYIQTPSAVIIEDVVQAAEDFGLRFIYADSAGKFENNALQTALNKHITKDGKRLQCKVIEVVFSKEKEGMLGNYRAHFERGKIKIPTEHQVALWQHKRYRYAKDSNKPMKKDDHVPDSTMCALQHWPLGKKKGDINDMRMSGGDTQPITSGLRKQKF